MYVTRIKLVNIRQFRSFDQTFCGERGSPKLSTLVLGDNATGKTTLLRCIAIGLSDSSTAAGLVREILGSLVTIGEKQGTIYVETIDDDGVYRTTKTILKTTTADIDVLRQEDQCRLDDLETQKKSSGAPPFPWDRMFVVGYGAGRIPLAEAQYERYRITDAVYTLFQYQTLLQQPELAWRRMKHHSDSAGDLGGYPAPLEPGADDSVRKLLASVLLLNSDETVELTPTGIHIRRRGGTVPLESCADGYRATTIWLIDLLSWAMIGLKTFDTTLIKGIVLIDEIEQHLHPRWQLLIMTRLRQAFPRIQFIATTHSPLCMAGLADLEEDEAQVVVVRETETSAVEPEILDLPRGLRTDQILTSGAFGLKDTRNPEIGEKVARFRELFRKSSLTDSETREMDSLRAELRDSVPEAVQFADEQEVLKELRKLSEDLKQYGSDSKT